jgi:hypothetical protein
MRSTTLCRVCLELFNTVGSTPAGTWSGAKPGSFGYPELTDAWGGSHHTEPGSFITAFERKCYICSTIFRDCSVLQRKQAWNFRIFYLFYELREQNTSRKPARYGLEFSIEIVRPDQDLTKELVFECRGVFKILPLTGKSIHKENCNPGP